jgi:hypothetical protein
MKSNAICPISHKKIDEHVARINGAFTLILLAAFLLTGNILPILFLLVDFALRSGKYSSYSAFSFLSRKILNSFSVKPQLINAGPKIFAARIGLVFSFAIILSFVVGLSNLSNVIIGIFAICAFLESALGYCVACQIYPFVYKFLYQNKFQKIQI